ncbi:hypothetical protein [Paraburkholderia dilworthii]|uniref:Uncharacterized protein n=1 Tax=Paraburkholderia dilworthii TaxID=948106 RepID=A0ABW9DFZ2_9BURK
MQLIASHAVKHPGKKLRKAELAAAAGITRQALHRYYAHLEPYISGERPAADRLDTDSKDAVLSTGIERLRVLETELQALKAGRDKEIERIRTEYVTSLMKSDLALHDVDGLRARLEAQSLHNDILINQIKSLEVALTAAKLDRLEQPAAAHGRGEARVRSFDIDLKRLFDSYRRHGDKSRLGKEKLQAVQTAVANARKAARDATIVIFIDRYLCSFNVFCRDFASQRNGDFAVVRAPIFSLLQLKTLVLSKLDVDIPVKIFLPYCESNGVAKAQRAFYFSYVPEDEIALADKLQGMSISDARVNEIVSYRIEQGE